MCVHISLSEADTINVARLLAKSAKPGAIYCLTGPLGAGKTVFTKGFAKGLDIPDVIYVTSPTFTLMNIYEGGRLPLYHFDVYRLTDPNELDDIGYEEYFFAEGVCLIEWADRISDLLPESAVWINLAYDDGNGGRVISIS